MKKFELSEALVNKILGYLAGQPFANVFQLINEIQKECQELPPVAPEEARAKK